LTSPNDIRALNVEATHAAYAEMFRDIRRLLVDDSRQSSGLARNARAHFLVSQIHWTQYWLPNLLTERYPVICQRMTGIILDGIAAPGSPWAPKTMPPRFPPPNPAGETAEEMFLRAATELINEQGYHGASVDRISGRLSLTKGAFYHHIPSKDDLLQPHAGHYLRCHPGGGGGIGQRPAGAVDLRHVTGASAGFGPGPVDADERDHDAARDHASPLVETL
jgi:hypothetical protein